MSRQPGLLREQQALAQVLKSPSASAYRGSKKAVEGTVESVLHPIQTASALVQALRHPKQTAKVVSKQLKEDFKRDPIETLAENFFPSPGGSVSKVRKIMVPSGLAYKTEEATLDALRDKIGKDISARKADLSDYKERTDWMEELEQTNDGWFPWGPELWKDIGHATPSPKFKELRTGDNIPLYEAIKHPELLHRLAQIPKAPYIRALRGLHTDSSGGQYVNERYAKHLADNGEPNAFPHVEVGGDPQSYGVGETMNHELQHHVQEVGRLPDPFRGTGLQDGLETYFMNPGEIQARVAGHQYVGGPANKIKASRLLNQERELMKDAIDQQYSNPYGIVRPDFYTHYLRAKRDTK